VDIHEKRGIDKPKQTSDVIATAADLYPPLNEAPDLSGCSLCFVDAEKQGKDPSRMMGRSEYQTLQVFSYYFLFGALCQNLCESLQRIANDVIVWVPGVQLVNELEEMLHEVLS
jgi:hypothetical protein